MEKKEVEIIANKMKMYVIIAVVNAIRDVLVVHQNILLNSTKNHLKIRRRI